MTERERLELFEEITEHLRKDEKPSVYITDLSKDASYASFPFSMLWKLKSTEQSKKFHPEGSVWNHTMMVLDEAAKVRSECTDVRVFMWAALLHDIGKPSTTRTRNGKTTSYDHDKEGEKLSMEFLEYFIQDNDFIKKVSSLVRYHMHMLYVQRKLPYGDVTGLLRRVDVNDITLLCRCDRLGRTGADIDAEEIAYQDFLKELNKLSL